MSSHPPPHARHPSYAYCYASENLENAQASGSELGYAELLIDVHGDPSNDYFADPGCLHGPTQSFIPQLEEETERKRRDRAWGEHIARVAEILARQHRTFAFSVALFGSRARLLRWDRVGCVVSQSFDIHENPELLCEFFWRFSAASDDGRGHDLTVEVARPEEEQLFHTIIKEQVQYQLGIHGVALDYAVREHYQPRHVAAVNVIVENPHSSTHQNRRLLISRPVISPLSVTGRGTRGYWAVNIDTKHVVFLKDTW